MTILLKILYWLAVLAISLALLVALVLFFESRDDSTLDEPEAGGMGPALVSDLGGLSETR